MFTRLVQFLSSYQRLPALAKLVGQIFLQALGGRLRTLSLLFAMGLSVSLGLAACSSGSPTSSGSPSAAPSPAQAQVLRVGYQKSATALNLLKTKGDLEVLLISCMNFF